ncbi:MAG: hypothetical protein HC889_17395 [Synechococcaceae cyanobacterium SM1_2_3]|nr:hypothetical protein [Synechococcaceae cyanobacterium SM1_2_3]
MMNGCQNVHPTVLVAIYGSVGLIWLCGGVWLINVWIDDPTVAFFASLLQQSLFVAASAGLIYWLRRPLALMWNRHPARSHPGWKPTLRLCIT